MALTVKEVEAAVAVGKRYRLSDGHGLHLEVDAQGRKYWNWRFHWPLRGPAQNQCDLRLGRCKANGRPGLSLKQAREARAEWEAIRQSGRDPRQVKKENSYSLCGMDGTSRFEGVAMDWVERRHDWSERHRSDTLSKLKLHVLPALGQLRVQEIRATHARLMLAPLEAAGKGETARKCLSIAVQVLQHAVINGWAELNPLAGATRGLAVRSVKKHYPSLSWREVPGFWEAAATYSGVMDQQTFNALRLQALTFVRPGELIGMRWEEIDWERRQWLIPAARMKGRRGHNRDHVVPLSTQALTVLRHQQQISGHHSYVFASTRSGSGYISNNTLRKAMCRMGYEGRMCAHGFRAMAMTALQEERQIDRLHIDRQLAHVPESNVAAAYNRAEYIEQRTALMQVWGDMLQEAGMTLPG